MAERRAVLRGVGAAALGVTTTVLPTAAQAFSLTVNGAPVAGVTVYWSERGSTTSATGRIGRLVYSGDGTVSSVDRDWLTDISSPLGLTTDGTALYYHTPFDTADKGIWRVAIDGTRTRLVASVQASGIFVDDTHLYYAADSNVHRIAKDGTGSATALSTASISPEGVTVAGDTVYFTVYGSVAGEGTVGTIPLAGGAPSEDFITGLDFAQDITVAGGVIYIGSGSTRVVYRYRTDGSAIGVVGASGYVDGIQVVDGVLFVGSSNSTYITASGLDGVNRDRFADTDGTTIVGINISGIAVLA